MIRLCIILFVTCLLGCQKNGQLPSELHTYDSLVKNAQDSKLTLETRLHFGHRADSIGRIQNDIQKQLECQLIIATLYWKLNNDVYAKNHFLNAVNLAKKISDQNSLGIALNNIGLI